MKTERCIHAAKGSADSDCGGNGTDCRPLRRAPRYAPCWALVWTLTACGAPSGPAAAPGSMGGPTRRDTSIVHEPCDIDASGVTHGDANADGQPDVVTVSAAGKRVCQWLDLNFDRVGDVWVYYTEDGGVRRRETDFDRDGRVDELTTLAKGVVTARQRATTLAGRLDTWQYFEAGVLTRSERDANGDGVIDQWWEYHQTKASPCAVVHSDTNGDGRPDPGATVDLCASEDAMPGHSQSADQDVPAFDAPLTESTTDVPPAAPPDQPSAPPSPASAPTVQGDAAGAADKTPTPAEEGR